MIRLIKKEELKTSNWSGGTTTEILIMPEGANYASRQFDWRLSTATVNLESSTFTLLEGVNRAILSLNASWSLSHDDEENITLKPYEVHYFDGQSKTVSEGQVVDFNLMTQNGYKGVIDVLEINPSLNSVLVEGIVAIYATSDVINCRLFSSDYLLEPGDLLYISKPASFTLEYSSSRAGKCLLIKISQ